MLASGAIDLQGSKKGMSPVNNFAIGFLVALILLISACENEQSLEDLVEPSVESAGSVVRFDSALNELVPIDAVIESVGRFYIGRWSCFFRC